MESISSLFLYSCFPPLPLIILHGKNSESLSQNGLVVTQQFKSALFNTVVSQLENLKEEYVQWSQDERKPLD